MDSAKNVRWIIPFKKFGMVRVKKRFFWQYMFVNNDHIHVDLYTV